MMKNEDEVEGGIEVEAPRTFFPDEVEGEVEGGRRDDTYVENVNGVPQPKTWYSRTIGKVAILFVAVFAVCIAIGYGSGYGIAEKVHSNKAAASVSSAKNGAYETYDTPSTAAKAAKASSETKASKASSDGSTKSSKSGGCVSDPPVAGGDVCCATTDCDEDGHQCISEMRFCGPRAGIVAPDTLDCSEDNQCTFDDQCTKDGEACLEGCRVEQCTAKSRPSGTCLAPVAFCRRALREGEDPVSKDVPLERRLEIIKRMEPHGAKADATFSFMYDLISKESCDALVKFMDSSLECDIDSGIDIPAGVSSHGAEEMYDSWTPFEGGVSNQYNKKLFAKDIVEIIGAEETMKIIDYFHESLGNLNIDCMYLARHGDPGDELFNVPWHKDNYATMEITLNDDYDGGEVLHLNESGVHVTDARPGSVTAHTDDIVHGITPNTNGAKYMLIIKHHFNRPDKQGVVRLSKELVKEAVANRHV